MAIGCYFSKCSGFEDQIRAIQLKTKDGRTERHLQPLYPLDLHCDMTQNEATPRKSELNPNPKSFRTKRAAVADEMAKISVIADIERDD